MLLPQLHVRVAERGQDVCRLGEGHHLVPHPILLVHLHREPLLPGLQQSKSAAVICSSHRLFISSSVHLWPERKNRLPADGLVGCRYRTQTWCPWTCRMIFHRRRSHRRSAAAASPRASAPCSRCRTSFPPSPACA
uniref:Uncharacterized protein n=1 Tax=Setaria italica TaxID=4555 RepID=K4AGH0_SETIT